MIKKLDDIERNDGFLDLDSYLIEKHQTLNVKSLTKNKIIERYKYYYFIKINGEQYLFKPCTTKEAIKELLAARMLDAVGYNHLDYDLAHVLGEYGVISTNYKKEGYNYISGESLIEAYCDLIDENYDENYDDYNKYNNLESIWDILEIKYKYHPNKNNIIRNIMEGLTEKFMFDILIAQDDGAAYNWEIEENKATATLVPIYDNGCMLDVYDQTLDIAEIKNIKVEETSSLFNEYSSLNEIKKFLHYSSDTFKSDFEILMRYLTPDDIKWFFLDIEKDLGVKISTKLKKDILSKYKKHYNDLQIVLMEELHKKR